MIALCVRFHWPGGVQPGGVVLCIILFNTPPNYINYAIDRMIDTGVGVIISLLVNYEFSRNRVETWLHMKNSKGIDAGTGETVTTDGEENSK